MFEIKPSEKQCGVGLFAASNIPIGTLIIREKPILVLNNEKVEKEVSRLRMIKLKRHDNIKDFNANTIAKKIVKVSFVIEDFIKLDEENRKFYLSLSDSFQYLDNKDVERFSLDIEAIQVLSRKQAFPFGQDLAARIWGIFNTNAFENGVCQNLSRVNHSCSPNTEFVWNNELQTQELRSVQNIMEGEELTSNYGDVEDGLNRNYRQSFLWDNFRFECICSCCQQIGDVVDREEARRKELMELHHLLNNCDTPQKIVANVNKQLKLAREIRGVKLQYHLQLLTIGYETVKNYDEVSSNRSEVMQAYAKRGSKISKILYGSDYYITEHWTGRLHKNEVDQ